MLGLAACAVPAPQTDIPVGDRDAHGCIGSAGYTYVAVLGRCARLWEDGVRLAPVQSVSGAEASAFAVLSDDGAQADLFLPGAKPVRLTRGFTQDGPYWSGGEYRLERLPEGWRLRRGGALVFTADNPAN